MIRMTQIARTSTLALIVAAGWAMPAMAQDAAAADDAASDDIVVTATPRGQNRLDTSISVSALSPEAIADAAPRTTAEIFRNLPGLRSEATGGDGNANIAVRGLPVAAGGAKFLQLQQDGLPVLQFGDIAFGNADIFLRADQTISRIEAVRGGSASTLASNSPGGIINFISRDGSQPGGVVMATIGLDYGEYRLDFDYGGRLGDSTRFNIGGFWRQGEGPRNAGYTANDGFQIRANLTQEFEAGYIRLYASHLNDRSIGYLPMPMRVTGTNADPSYESFPGFDILNDTPHSALFQTDLGLDGNNNRRVTDIRDGMHPVVTSVGLEAHFELNDALTLENRFRWSDVRGRFVSPFPSEVGAAQGIANSVGELLTGVAGTYGLAYANGPNAGQAVNAATVGGNGLVMRTHLFNTELNSLDNFTNDFRLIGDFGGLTVTAGLYKARQTIDMDWLWNSYLMEVRGDNAALLNVTGAGGAVLSQNGLYAYGVPFWGNCCQRSYDVNYDLTAAYAAFGYEVGGFNLDASLRYDWVRARGTYAGAVQSANFDVSGDGVIQAPERSVSIINNAAPSPVDYNVGYRSWSVGANYRFSDVASAFARASRGGRSNADRLLFGVVLPDGSVRREDAIDFVNQYEAGFKYRSGGTYLYATLFHARTQEQNYELNNQRFLDRTYTATGIELEGGWRSGIFDIRGGVTWTDAEISSDAISPANEGNTPRRQAAFIYSFTPALDFEVARIGFNLIGTTKAYAQDNNDLVFPAYAQVNAFASYNITDALSVSVNANNLFNAVGITEAEEGSIVNGATNYVRARSINGRTISASIRYEF